MNKWGYMPKDDDNENLHTANIKSYWHENEEKKAKACRLHEENAWPPALKNRFRSTCVCLVD